MEFCHRSGALGLCLPGRYSRAQWFGAIKMEDRLDRVGSCFFGTTYLPAPSYLQLRCVRGGRGGESSPLFLVSFLLLFTLPLFWASFSLCKWRMRRARSLANINPRRGSPQRRQTQGSEKQVQGPERRGRWGLQGGRGVPGVR